MSKFRVTSPLNPSVTDSPHNGPVMRNTFPCHDVTMVINIIFKNLLTQPCWPLPPLRQILPASSRSVLSTCSARVPTTKSKITLYDDVIKWTHFPHYWPFVRGVHRSPVNPPHKGQWRGALMFYLICAWINSSVNNREAGNLRRHRGHYDVNVMGNYEQDIWRR